MEQELDDGTALDLPIDGTLDLHTFQPSEVKSLVEDYLRACQCGGIREIRIIHGKGKGHLRRMVHAELERNPEVLSYRLAGEDAGGWGATLVELKGLSLNGEHGDRETETAGKIQ
jgi:DNA-nicking Smr family endonuclease